MCDPKKLGIPRDDRKPFFSKVEDLTNLYAYTIGLGGSYGHKFKPIELPELVNFMGW